MKLISTVVIIMCCVGLSLFSYGQAPELDQLDIVQRSVPAGPVALVRGAPISRDHFLRFYESRLASVTMMKRGASIEDSIRVRVALGVLAELIQRELLLQEVKKSKITVSDAKVDAAFEKEVKNLQSEIARQGGDTPSEAEILERFGQSVAEAKADLRKSLLIREYRDHLAKEKNLSISDKEIQSFYDENPDLFQRPGMVHLKQMYIQPRPNAQKADDAAWADAEKKMKKALARIRAGESFAAVARDMSESPDSTKGGDMGSVPTAQLPEFIATEAVKLEPGQMSDVFRSNVGFHLIQLVERDSENKVTLEKARKKITAVLLESKIEKAIDDLCEPVVSDPTQVTVFLQLERTLAALAPPATPAP